MRSQMKSVQNLLLFSFVVAFFHLKTDLGLRTFEYIFFAVHVYVAKRDASEQGWKTQRMADVFTNSEKYVHERSARVIDVYFSHFAIS